MKVYDFDDTILDGDSTKAFYLFCLSKKPSLLRFLPRQGWAFFRYWAKRIEKTHLKEIFFSFLQGIDYPDQMVEQFWEQHKNKIFPWYLAQMEGDDVIISASPEFLLAPICQKLRVGTLLASQIDPRTGKALGKNCLGPEKVVRFKEAFGNTPVSEFYSDSLSDTPMAALAERAFLVKKGSIKPWPQP